jgi:hypothetical protein
MSWFAEYQVLFTGLFITSLITFILSLILLPWLVARIPRDYFLSSVRNPEALKKNHPLIRLILIVGKNTVGAVLLTGGVIMLFIPGQGLLTIAMGLLLMDYPGKFQLERRIARNKAVLNGLNWLRAKVHAAPLEVDSD